MNNYILYSADMGKRNLFIGAVLFALTACGTENWKCLWMY